MLHSGTCDSADVRAECVILGRVYVIHNVDAFFQLNKCFASWWKTLIPDLLLRYKEGSYYYAIYTIATFLGKYCIAIHKWALWVLIKTSHFVCQVRNKKLLANMLTVAITFIVNRNCCLLFLGEFKFRWSKCWCHQQAGCGFKAAKCSWFSDTAATRQCVR